MDHMCRPNLGARVQRGSRWSPRGTKVLSEVAHWTTIRCQVACQIVRAPRPPPLFYALFLFTRTHFKVSRLQTRRRGGERGRAGRRCQRCRVFRQNPPTLFFAFVLGRPRRFPPTEQQWELL